MTDLHRRFTALDAVPARLDWGDVERRLGTADATSVSPGRPTFRGGGSARGRSAPSRGFAFVIAAAIAATAAGGAVLVGSRLLEPNNIQPDPTFVGVPSASPSPSATLPAAPSVTVRPEPSNEVGLTIAEPALIVWPRLHPYLGTVQIVQAMRNTSSAWIEVHASDSWYQWGDDVRARTTFAYAYPRFVPPGATAYLSSFAPVVGGGAPRSPRTHVSYEALTQAPSALLSVRNDSVRVFRDDRLRVTGQVTNVGAVDVASGQAAAVFLDGGGNILGLADDGSLDQIRVGETKAFTIASDNPLDLSAVATVVVVAGTGAWPTTTPTPTVIGALPPASP